VLDLSSLDLEEIATALADQTDYEHRWLINPETGEVVFWASDTGIDGQTPVDLDELDLICIDPVLSYIWYQDMAYFADQVSDERAWQRLARAIQGKGAFRRFKAELYEEYPQLLPAWYAFRDARAHRRGRVARRQLARRPRRGHAFPPRASRAQRAVTRTAICGDDLCVTYAHICHGPFAFIGSGEAESAGSRRLSWRRVSPDEMFS
jgi:hypothetical protein